MKTKPFNTPDVQAILAGRKTMFREVIKPQPPTNSVFIDLSTDLHFPASLGFSWAGFNNPNDPYYYKGRFKHGDIIAVKETWAISYDIEDHYELEHPCVGISEDGYSYKADGKPSISGPWHSPVTMPREAHRIFLEVVSVKVERLLDISIEDVIKEGIEEFTKDNIVYKYGIDGWDWSTMPRTPKEAYQRLYNINPDQWQRNEWVFVYEFRRVEKP